MIDVVCAVLRDGEKILIARRSATSRDAGLWELPGGKPEPGESCKAALARELAEELAIVAEIGERVGSAETSRSQLGEAVRLTAFLVDRWTGQPKLAVHDALKWVTPAEALRMPMPAVDLQLLRDIQPRSR